MAHALMFFARGVPVIYYGDEQGFSGDGGDKDAREDMFPSLVKDYQDNKLLGTSKTPKDNNFDKNHPLYTEISKLAKVYQAHPLLRSGEQHPFETKNNQLITFIRTNSKSKEQYLVAFNLSDKPVTVPTSFKGVKAITGAKLVKGGFEVAAQDYGIIKSSKQTSNLLSKTTAKFTKPDANARVAGLFHVELNVPGNDYNRVDFSMTDLGTSKTIKLISDFNRPYRAYIDTKAITDGTQLRITARVSPENGKPYSIEHPVTVDGRTPQVVIHYENGNKRNEVFHILSNGRSSLTQKASKGKPYTFSWPKGTPGAMVLFSDLKGEFSEFDEPIYIDFKKHVLPNLKAQGKGILARLYVDNAHNISTKPLSSSKSNPRILPFKPKAKAPFGKETLYVRGGMNAWQASTPLNYQGNFTYTTQVALSSGLVEYKFADEAWSGNVNFGSPINPEGLTKSGGSGNLKLVIGDKEKEPIDSN